MLDLKEWKLELLRERGEVTAALYEVDERNEWHFIDAEVFGPFDTALDVSTWFIRHWSPRAGFPMR